jgi:hypothetical protein
MTRSHYQNLVSYCAEETANNAQYNKPCRNRTRKFERGAGIWRCQSKNLSNTPKSTADIKETRHVTLRKGAFFPLLFEGYKFGHCAYRQNCQHCIIALSGLRLFIYHAELALILLIITCMLKETGSFPSRIIIFLQFSLTVRLCNI